MKAPESFGFGAGWSTGWHLVGGTLAIIAQMVGVMTLVVMVMGITLFYHDIMITNECIDTNKIVLIQNDYTIECTATPVAKQEE